MKNAVLALALLIATAAFADTVVKRGAAISKTAKPTPIADVLAAPDQYAKNSVLVEGVIENVCEMKGCWMQLTQEAGKPGVRVTFKDYGFFVPTDSKGMKARAEGVVEVKTLTKKQADHLEHEDGAKLTRNADGSAREIEFVASGVELRKQ
jgi:2-keto-4-pentenoate hydratase